MALYDVFISYSSKDQKVVEGICGYLESHGIRCFVAYRDIPRGVDWAKAIVEALDRSAMMVIAFSDNFNRSEEVDREIAIASQDHKPILTFRLSDSQFEGTKKYYLFNLNWIDAFPNPDRYFGDLYKNVCWYLSKSRVSLQSTDEEGSINDMSQITAEKGVGVAIRPFNPPTESSNQPVTPQRFDAPNISMVEEVSILAPAIEKPSPNSPSTGDSADEEISIRPIEDSNVTEPPVEVKETGSETTTEDLVEQRVAGPAIKCESESFTSSVETVGITVSQNNGYQWVDMGLPSATKWATCNIGASKAEEYGEFFAWGEVESKTSFKDKNIITAEKSYELLLFEGIIDSSGNLTKEYDAATRLWGEPWRMPTKDQMQELRDNTRQEWTSVNGIKGKLLTSKLNGAQLFFPATGQYNGSLYYCKGSLAYGWTATAKSKSKKKAYAFNMVKGFVNIDAEIRYYGFPIRPVTQ